jgi:hypothetical protein
MDDTAGEGFEGSCIGCGYQLRGLTERRCPECGRPFDPNDPRTFHTRATEDSVRQWLASPPGWPTHAATVLAVLASLWWLRKPGDEFFNFWRPSAFVPWTVLGIIWSMRLALRWGELKNKESLSRGTHGRARSWLIVPLVFSITLLLTAASVPMSVAFWISRPAMDAIAQQAAKMPPGTTLPDQWIGLYRAKRIEVSSNGLQFLIDDSGGLLDATGFIYSPGGPPPDDKHNWYVHWGRNWYMWRAASI